MKRLFQGFLAIPLLVAGGLTCSKPTPVAPSEAILSITADPLKIIPRGISEITVIGRQADGSPVNEGTEILFTTTLGSVDRVVAVDDRGVAVAELVGDGTIGMATVEASSGAAAAVTVEVQIGSLASFLSFSANPTLLSKDLPRKGAKISLSAVAQDDTGAPLEKALVTFSSERGILESGSVPVETDVSGLATDTLTVFEDDLASVTEGFFEVSASTPGVDGEIVETIEIEVSGFPAHVTLEAKPTSVPDTGGIIELVALVLDDLGDPAEGAGVNFITEAGDLASRGLVLTDAEGIATDILTVTGEQLAALPADNNSTFTVTAEVAGSGGEVFDDTVTIRIEGVTSLTLAKEVENSGVGTADGSEWLLEALGGPTPLSGFGPTVTSGVGFEAGTYSLRETGGPTDRELYDAGEWTCQVLGEAGTASGSTITVEEGDAVVCTITNTFKGATLTLVKSVVTTGGGTAVPSNWTLSAEGPTAVSVTGSSSGATRTVREGTYRLSEAGTPPTGETYDEGPWSCSGATVNGGDTITLNAGDIATCTITNTFVP
jgi:hypothetical protein